MSASHEKLSFVLRGKSDNLHSSLETANAPAMVVYSKFQTNLRSFRQNFFEASDKVPVLAFLMGFTNTPINVAVMPLLLYVTPQKFVGRVAAVLAPMMSAASTLSIALAGYLASTVLRHFHSTTFGIAFGPVDTIFTCAGLLAVIAGLYAMVGLRGVRLEDDNETTRSLQGADS